MLDLWAHVDSLCRMHLLEDYKHYSIVGSKARAIYEQTRCYAYGATIKKTQPRETSMRVSGNKHYFVLLMCE